jgi:hypothetical protein
MFKTAAVAAVVAVATVALAAPAQADQYDFISVLDGNGVSYESVIDMIDTGTAICHDLRMGLPIFMPLGELERNGFTLVESGVIVSAAAFNMCPDQRQVVIDYYNPTPHPSPHI